MRFVISLCAVALLSGCFSKPPVYWQHKTIPSEKWSSDKRRCTRAVDKHLGLTAAYHADQQISTYDERMRVYEVGKKQKKLVADCMRKLGYVPVR